jgi:outer membrane autotransporter protein
VQHHSWKLLSGAVPAERANAAATDHSSISSGVYTISGTAVQMQADLRALAFTPALNTTGQTTTTFSVKVTNVAGLAATRAAIQELQG